MLPLTPTRLGRYEIVDEIGKGAMGVVYLARDPLIGRLVALKTFRIGYSIKDQEVEQFRIRFMREAQSAGILTHPNIVTIHDVVEDSGEGLAFIAMEYVRGTNLKLMLQAEQPLSLQFVLDVTAQVADALDYAHSNRVVHRDVKPANILITTDNRVKITDFGIARLDSSNLTQEGQLLGTPNYMAPEQIQGREVDSRADLFSLGVVVYEMLTRHKPFQGENLTVVSHRIVYDPFTPPRDYVRELPPGVERILNRALEKDPSRRYQRAREMVEELRRVVESSPVSRDALNETQSLSSTMVLPPLEPPPPRRPAKPSLLSRWRRRPAPRRPPATAADASRGSSAPPPLAAVPPLPPAADPLADTVSTEAPPPPVRRPLPTGRLLGAAALAGLVLAVGYAGVLLWRGWSQPPVQEAAAGEPQGPARVPLLVNQGSQALRRGDYPTAIALLRQAEQLEPGRDDLRRLREAAENQAEDFKNLVDQEKEIAADLAQAREALARKSYEQAVALASLALGIDPENEDAKALLAQAQQAQAAAREKRQRPSPAQPAVEAPREESVASLPPPRQPPPAGPGEARPAEARVSSLQVHFRSDLDAVLIVRIDNRQVLRRDFARGGGLFRPRRDAEGHELTETLEVPPGSSKVLVHVTPKGEKAQVRQLDLAGNGSKRLEISLSRSAGLTAQLI